MLLIRRPESVFRASAHNALGCWWWWWHAVGVVMVVLSLRSGVNSRLVAEDAESEVGEAKATDYKEDGEKLSKLLVVVVRMLLIA